MDKLLSDGITLTPAYGRDYKSRKAVVEGLNKPEDFSAIHYARGETYCSVKDLANGTWNVRYAKLGKVALINVSEGVAS